MSFFEQMVLENKLEYILNTISPVFLVIMLGGILRLTGFIKDEITQALSKLTYWVALPTLLFYHIATTKHGFSEALGIYYVVLATALAAIILAITICLLFGIDRKNAGAFIQGSYRGNLVFIGLPLVIYSLTGTNQDAASKLGEMAILSLSLAIPTYNAIAITLLLICRHNIDIKMPVKIAKGLITNPLVISVICGILYAHFFKQIPVSIERSCQIVGRMALPLALLSIGASLVSTSNTADYSLSIVASLIKVAACPIIGFFIARWLNLNTDQTRIAMLFTACPAAVSSYIMASQMGSNGRLAAAIVVVSSFMSVAAIIAVLMVV